MFWGGLLVVGVLAIPAGMLFGMLFLIGEGLNFVLKKLGGK